MIFNRAATKRSARRVQLFQVGAAVALGSCGCQKSTQPPQAAPVSQAAHAPAATQVEIHPAALRSISEVAEVTGSLSALQDVTVGVKIAGKVTAVYAREGDVVHAGQVVAQQDTSDLQNQLDTQRASLITYRAKLAQSRVALTDAVTTLSLTRSQTESAVKQAQAALRSAEDQLSITRKGARIQELQQAQESVSAAKSDRDRARADLKRYQGLYREQAISAQQLDQAQSTADSADAHYNAAVASLSLTREGARPEDIRRAESAVEQARQALITAQANRGQVTLRRADVDTARAGIVSAEASVQQATAAVRLAEQALRDAAVRSPIDGVVAERKVEPGMQLSAQKGDVMRIVSLNNIYFDAELPEKEYAYVHSGLPVTVRVDALPGRSFAGNVRKIFPVASSTSRSFTVRVGLRNDGGLLRPAMFARGEITLATHSHAVVLGRDAILDLANDHGRVFVASRGIAHQRRVTTGFTSGSLVEVVSGVNEGENVITSGQATLQNEDKVQIQTLQ